MKINKLLFYRSIFLYSWNGTDIANVAGMKMKQRYAVASQEGLAVSEHFGHAKRFFVYDVSAQGCQLVEQREVSHYCLGGHSDKSALVDILETIRDCKAVFVAKIGDGPTEKLAARGITAVSDYAWEEIEPSLLDYLALTGA